MEVRRSGGPRKGHVATRASGSVAHRRVESDTLAAGMPAPARGGSALSRDRGPSGNQSIHSDGRSEARNAQAGPGVRSRGICMNTQTETTSFGPECHPDENPLLLALERELSPEETAQVEKHLGNCWSCRARSSEMQSGILAFVEYREKRYLPSLDPPPHDYRSFPGELRRIADDGKPVGWSGSILSSV